MFHLFAQIVHSFIINIKIYLNYGNAPIVNILFVVNV